MKIALICTEKLPVPPIRGGAIQVLIDGVLPYLNERNDVTVFGIADPDLDPAEIKNGIEYIRVPQENYVSHIHNALAQKFADRVSYDLVHVFNRPLDVLTYKLAQPNSRFVLSLHNEMFKDTKITQEAGEAVIQSVERIMTVSAFIAKTITNRFPIAIGKVQPVYSGMDLMKYTPIWDENVQSLRAELRGKYKVDGKKVILFVGRLSKVKGPEILLEAMKDVLVVHPDAVVVIVGSKWFSDETIDDYGKMLRSLAKSLGSNKVIFTGFVPPIQIPTMYLLGDLFVCSSQWEEPLARVHYEAMGAGLPIITTNRGGNAEVVHHNLNGIVLDDYTNSKAFSEAIIDLLSNADKANALSREGRKHAENTFGFEQVYERLENFYLTAMNAEKAEIMPRRQVERFINSMNKQKKKKKRKADGRKRTRKRNDDRKRNKRKSHKHREEKK